MGIAGAGLVHTDFFLLKHAGIAGVFTETKPAILHIYIQLCQLHALFTGYAN